MRFSHSSHLSIVTLKSCIHSYHVFKVWSKVSMKVVKALVRLLGCAGSSEHSLFAYAISTKSICN